jgi:hypothetical protein
MKLILAKMLVHRILGSSWRIILKKERRQNHEVSRFPQLATFNLQLATDLRLHLCISSGPRDILQNLLPHIDAFLDGITK